MPEKRSPVKAVVFTIITLGIYGIYWFYKTSKYLINYTKKDSSPGVWLIGFLIPFVNIVIIWKYSHLLEEATKGKREGILIFVLWLVLFPAAIYVIQKDINGLE